MISLLRRLGGLDLTVVANEIGIILAGVGADEAVIAIEAAPERPAVKGSGSAYLLGRRQMPFPESKCIIALPKQNLGQKSILERNGTIGTGITCRALSDARHCIGMICARSGCRNVTASTARWCACW